MTEALLHRRRPAMIGPNGSEVPYQWVTSCSDATALNGCIAVRSNLAPNTTDTWTLQSGAAPSATPINPVQAVQVGQNWKIKNGLTGVRILATAANPAPWTLAPIQGILLPNGTLTGAGKSPNMLYSETNQGGGAVGCVGCVLQTPIYNATGYSVTVTTPGHRRLSSTLPIPSIVPNTTSVTSSSIPPGLGTIR